MDWRHLSSNRRLYGLAGNGNRFQDQVVIITGASSGIGRACALEFAGQGARVVLAARRRDVLEEVKEEIERRGGRAHPVTCDVTRVEDCRTLMEATVKEFGQIDVLINNAGISMRAAFEDLDLRVIRKLMDTNFYGAVYCTKFALPFLLKRKGTLVAISSITGLAPLPGRTGYAASKHAMEGFFNTLRLENRHRGLNVMLVHPGFTASEIRYNALNARCMPQGVSPRDESSMMTCERVAWYISRAVCRRQHDLVLTPQGRIIVWLHRYLPGIAGRIVALEMAREDPVKWNPAGDQEEAIA
jgi:NAD(P)-dependent dehydrogenase (short-subunit alcohol dehydrogenase family)